jgi:probable HAF family extracellular repeat protein
LGRAVEVNTDGSVIVGFSEGALGFEPFRWTAEIGMVSLGSLVAGGTDGSALGVSADGSVVVGYSKTDRGFEAFVWDAGLGMRSLTEVLADDLGVDLTGWRLEFATGISADGATIIGQGIDPAGRQASWIAFIPEPGTALLVSGGLVVMRLAARRLRVGLETRATSSHYHETGHAC